MGTVIFEKMDISHQKRVMQIFNYYIEHTTFAFSDVCLPEMFYISVMEKTKKYVSYVVIDENHSEIIGFCYLSAYHIFPTFKDTVNISYFIAPEYRGKGVGSLCLERLENEALKMGIQNLIAQISSENIPSIKFHQKHGFSICGQLKNIGAKFNRRFDVIYMQKELAC